MSQSNTPDPTIQEQIPSSISAAAQAHQTTMDPRTATPVSTAIPLASAVDTVKDIVMTDSTPDRPESPAVHAGAASAASPAPHRVGTPSRTTNGNDVTSRAASLHPDPAPTFPKEAPPHGAPTRQYLNSKVTSVLLEGVKQLAKDQPKDPLRVLGEYLLQRSREIEGTGL